MERLNSSKKVAGVKQTKMAVNADLAKVVYLAKDADITLIEGILKLCNEKNIEVVTGFTRKELSKAARIDVPTAAAAVLK